MGKSPIACAIARSAPTTICRSARQGLKQLAPLLQCRSSGGFAKHSSLAC